MDWEWIFSNRSWEAVGRERNMVWILAMALQIRKEDANVASEKERDDAMEGDGGDKIKSSKV